MEYMEWEDAGAQGASEGDGDPGSESDEWLSPESAARQQRQAQAQADEAQGVQNEIDGALDVSSSFFSFSLLALAHQPMLLVRVARRTAKSGAAATARNAGPGQEEEQSSRVRRRWFWKRKR